MWKWEYEGFWLQWNYVVWRKLRNPLFFLLGVCIRMMPGAAPCATVSYVLHMRVGLTEQVSEIVDCWFCRSPIPDLWRLSSMCFLLLNTFLFSSCSLGFYGGLTSLLFFVSESTSCWLHSALVSALDSANVYIAKAQLHCPPHPPSPRTIVPPLPPPPLPPNSVPHRRPHVVHVSVMPEFSECERKLTFISVTTAYVRTYAHPKNISLIQSLVLMRLAITLMVARLVLLIN